MTESGTPQRQGSEVAQRHRRRSRTISAGDLIGLPVHDMLGTTFGRLDELVFEIDRGMAAYVVIDCDNGRRCALPYELIRIENDPLCVKACIHRDVFLAKRRDESGT